MHNLIRTKTKYTYFNLGNWTIGFPKSLSATTVCSSLNFWNHNGQLSWTLRSLSITYQLWNYSGKSANRSDSHSLWVLSLGSFWHITAPEQCKLVVKYRTNEPEEQMGSPQTHPHQLLPEPGQSRTTVPLFHSSPLCISPELLRLSSKMTENQPSQAPALSPPPAHLWQHICAHFTSTGCAGRPWPWAESLPGKLATASSQTAGDLSSHQLGHPVNTAARVFSSVELAFTILKIKWWHAALIQEKKLQIPGPFEGLFSQWINGP